MKENITIALTYTGSEKKHENYVRWLKEEESKAIKIVTFTPGTSTIPELEYCDGLVLSGGIDIHPSLYGMQEGYAHQPEKFYLERDGFEKALFEKAQQMQMPVLGICRGLQLINCVLGGSLQRDIGDSKNALHKVEDVVDKIHFTNIQKDSLLQGIMKTERITVNSAHHQAVERVAADMQVSATSDDGIIEALEWKNKNNKPFLLCIQWHPERMFQLQLQETGAAKAIRDRFVQEVREQKAGNVSTLST